MLLCLSVCPSPSRSWPKLQPAVHVCLKRCLIFVLSPDALHFSILPLFIIFFQDSPEALFPIRWLPWYPLLSGISFCFMFPHDYYVHPWTFPQPDFKLFKGMGKIACIFPFNPKSLVYCSEWKLLSRVWLFATPWTIQSMEFSRPKYWSVCSLSLLQGIFPTQQSNPGLPHCREPGK